MKFRLVCVGRLSLPYLREGADDYLQRLKRYLPLVVDELREESGGSKPDPARIRELEGIRLLARIPAGARVVALDERGTALTSEELAAFIDRQLIAGSAELVWVIGGAYGLSEAVRRRADRVLSLSALTFTHQLARVILLEQLYRSFTIIRGEPYHNR